MTVTDLDEFPLVRRCPEPEHVLECEPGDAHGLDQLQLVILLLQRRHRRQRQTHRRQDDEEDRHDRQHLSMKAERNVTVDRMMKRIDTIASTCQ